MYKFFVGVDVSKSWIDVSSTDGSIVTYTGQFNNSIPGFEKVISQLGKITLVDKSEWFICFENTGTYSKQLLQWLCSQEIACREENPLLISSESGMRRGKSDKLDADLITTYVYKNRDKIQPTRLPAPAISELKKLISIRNLYVRQCATLKSSLKEHRAEFSTEFLKQMEQRNNQLIDSIQEHISFIENQIEILVNSDEEMKKNAKLSQSVIGIGPVITWYLIATTGNFKNFATSRKYSTYGGIAPFPKGSGIKKGRNKVSQLGDKQIKSLLSNGALAAIQYDPELRNYYQKKISQGKVIGVALNNVKNKLVARVFAVVHRGTPFVKLHNYA